MFKPARLCQYDMPNGKLCRQVALKGEQVCRHHMRLFRHDMYEITHREAMERLEAKLNNLDLLDLLSALQYKLTRLQSTVRADPEAQLTLRVALEHLRKRTEAERSFQQFTQQNPMPDITSPEFSNLFEKFMESMN